MSEPSFLPVGADSPDPGAHRIGQPWAQDAIGRDPLRWALIFASGLVLAAAALHERGPVTGTTTSGPLTAFAYATLLFCLPLIAAVDLRLSIIPNRILLPLAVLAGVCLTSDWIAGPLDESGFVRALAAFLGAGLYGFVVWFVAPVGGFGLGDVKLLALCGFLLGAHSIWLAIAALLVAPPLLALLPMLLATAFQRTGKASIPFGPFIAASVAACVLLQAFITGLNPLTT